VTQRQHRFIQQPRGFTLIELLVVLVIIGIVTGFAVLSVTLKSETDRVEIEARRLVALMQLASDEAVISANQLGMQIEANRYRFITLQDDIWRPVENDDIFRERELPDDASLELHIEGKQVLPGEGNGSIIYFLSSGEISPFELVLRTRDARHKFVVKGALHGRIDYLGEQDT
jgi:general secretion pathway protein H